MKVCVILGSSNLTGHTYSLVKETFEEFDLIQLAERRISFFDYSNQYENDDFMQIIEQALEADLIVLASPVYWYSISAQMKIFLDRLTDLLYFDKSKLVAMRKKKFAYLSVYSSDPGYALEIILKTCEYLNVDLVGTLVVKGEKFPPDLAKTFYAKCLAACTHEKASEEQIETKKPEPAKTGNKK